MVRRSVKKRTNSPDSSSGGESRQDSPESKNVKSKKGNTKTENGRKGRQRQQQQNNRNPGFYLKKGPAGYHSCTIRYWRRPGAVLHAIAQTGSGLYPNPIGKAGIAAVDVRDIADAAVVSLTTDGHTAKTYNLVGPDPLSGPSAAAICSVVLNKQVRYADLPVEAYEGVPLT